ncbi:MAG: alpha/beta hydrolase [Burkholderiales bacterium]|nr:alpha/beta hydrolase [Anaerolineae bacterium]
MSAITLAGELVHYEVLGRGRPIVLVHGWIGSWRYWIPTMQQLQLKYRVYALDLFGFGDSGKNPQKYTLDQQVQLLTNFMRELGVTKTALVGHGLGALVSAEFARLYQERVPRLAIISAPLFDTGDLNERSHSGKPMPLTANSVTPGVAPSGAVTANSVSSSISVDAPAINGPLAAEATIMSASTAMRAALAEAARARSDMTAKVPDGVASLSERLDAAGAPAKRNLLQSSIGDAGLEELLGRCFKRSEPEYAKLKVDVDKTDGAALKYSVMGYDAGRMLDTLRALTMPTVVVHGMDDPVIPDPGENVWNYLTAEKEDTMMPVLLPGVRHFPMLEHERFFRLLTDFLDIADISKLELKERWTRRTR